MLTDEQKKEMLLELSDLCEKQAEAYETAFRIIGHCIDKLSTVNNRLREASNARGDTSVALKEKANGARNASLAEVSMNMFHLDRTLELFTRYTEGCKEQLESMKALNDTCNKRMGDLDYELANP